MNYFTQPANEAPHADDILLQDYVMDVMWTIEDDERIIGFAFPDDAVRIVEALNEHAFDVPNPDDPYEEH